MDWNTNVHCTHTGKTRTQVEATYETSGKFYVFIKIESFAFSSKYNGYVQSVYNSPSKLSKLRVNVHHRCNQSNKFLLSK